MATGGTMTDSIPADVRHFWMTVALGLKDELVVRGNRIAELEQERDELRAQLAHAKKQGWGAYDFWDNDLDAQYDAAAGDMSAPELDGSAFLHDEALLRNSGSCE